MFYIFHCVHLDVILMHFHASCAAFIVIVLLLKGAIKMKMSLHEEDELHILMICH